MSLDEILRRVREHVPAAVISTDPSPPSTVSSGAPSREMSIAISCRRSAPDPRQGLDPPQVASRPPHPAAQQHPEHNRTTHRAGDGVDVQEMAAPWQVGDQVGAKGQCRAADCHRRHEHAVVGRRQQQPAAPSDVSRPVPNQLTATTMIATPRPAPLTTPSTHGSARGFLKSVCSSRPVMPMPAPASTAAQARGRRKSSTIRVHEARSGTSPVKMSTRALIGIGTTPMVSSSWPGRYGEITC